MTYANEEQHSDTLTSDSGYIQQLTFAGCPSFMRWLFSRELAGIDPAITDIPFDCATTNRPGTRLGPRATRESLPSQSGLRMSETYIWHTQDLMSVKEPVTETPVMVANCLPYTGRHNPLLLAVTESMVN